LAGIQNVRDGVQQRDLKRCIGNHNGNGELIGVPFFFLSELMDDRARQRPSLYRLLVLPSRPLLPGPEKTATRGCDSLLYSFVIA
jgi:hypothetical protein